MSDTSSESESATEDDFSYDGRLVFNGIYRTEKHGFDNDGYLTESFDQYSKGVYPDPNEGYLELDEKSHNLSSIDGKLSDTLDRLQGFKYRFDDWNPNPVENNGSVSQEPVYDPGSFDVYCFDPDHIFLRGPKDAVDKKRTNILGGLPSDLSPTEVQFSPDFLFWILYKCMKGESLNSTISVRRLPNCETTGSRDNIGEGIQVKGSDNVERSVPILVTFLEDKEISSIRGHFVVDTSFIVADIDADGSVRVRTSHEKMEKLSELRRVAVSLRFLHEFISLYENWKSSPVEEKYPEDMFRVVYELSVQEGYEPAIKPSEQIEQYEKKRRAERVQANGDES